MILKTYKVCETATQWFYFDLSPYWLNWYASLVSSLPTGIVEATDGVTGSTIGFGVQNTFTGTGTVTIEGFKEISSGESLGEFELVFTRSCRSEQEITCCDEQIEIRWLGIEGGIKSFPFTGVREFDIRVGDGLTFKDRSRNLRYSQRKDVYTGKRITTDFITQAQLDYLDEVKYAIQVWEWDGEVATPITVDNESFGKYNSRDKFFEVSLQYVMAKEIKIQVQ